MPFVLILLGLAFIVPPVGIYLWVGVHFGFPAGIDLTVLSEPVVVETMVIVAIGMALIAFGVYRIVRPHTYPQLSN